MRRRGGAFGGVLLDLFIIFILTGVLIIGLIAGWLVWRKGGGVLRNWNRVTDMVPAMLRGPRPEAPSSADLNISDRSAWIQGRTRDLLTRRGLGEKSIVKTYNVERREGGIVWLEDTLVVRRPPERRAGEALRDDAR